jgi:hypothetical protein
VEVDHAQVDINIDDILADPSLNQAMYKSEVENSERMSEVVDEVLKTKEELPDDKIVEMIEKKKVPKANGKKAIVPVDTAPIINDPDELLIGSLTPPESSQQLIVDPVKNDALCAFVKNEDSTDTLMGHVMSEIAEELAFLKAYRRVHYLANEDISEISLKRVKSLKNLVEAIVEREKLKNNAFDGKIDFYGDKFERVMEFIFNTVKGAFDKVGIPEQFNDIFFTQLAQDLEGFEKKVEKIYYGKSKSK